MLDKHLKWPHKAMCMMLLTEWPNRLQACVVETEAIVNACCNI